MAAQNLCPCTSGLPYRACCAPYHRGEAEPPGAEALMRSRFSAFARGDADYLWKTLHPDHEDRQLREADVRRSIKATASSLRFMRLHVLDRREADEAGTAKVLFLAEVFEKGKDRSFLELSSFRHDGVGWRYVEGSLRPAPGLGEGAKGLSIDAFERGATRGK